MASKAYLIFSLHDLPYAIAAERVREIFLLPELTPVVEAPADIVGLLDFHGRMIPMMHLDLRFGYSFERCYLGDSAIVVESQGLQVGIIVNQVRTVVDLDDRYIQPDLAYGREQNLNQAFVSGTIDLDDEKIILLNVDNLIRDPDAVVEMVRQAKTGDNKEMAAKISTKKIGSFYDLYCPQATAKEKAIFRSRAANIKKNINSTTETTNLTPVAVIRLGSKYYGIDLNIIREFINIKGITTIPCCPGFILGNINLRGEILTVVDIRSVLNLQLPQQQPIKKAVVIEIDEIVAGIGVDEVCDAVDFRPEDLKSVPLGINSSTAKYLKATASYLDRPLNIIDVSKIFSEGALSVDMAA